MESFSTMRLINVNVTPELNPSIKLAPPNYWNSKSSLSSQSQACQSQVNPFRLCLTVTTREILTNVGYEPAHNTASWWMIDQWSDGIYIFSLINQSIHHSTGNYQSKHTDMRSMYNKFHTRRTQKWEWKTFCRFQLPKQALLFDGRNLQIGCFPLQLRLQRFQVGLKLLQAKVICSAIVRYFIYAFCSIQTT